MSSSEKMQCILQRNASLEGAAPRTSTMLRLSKYPKELVQTMLNYLYTGIMEKPQNPECELFEQLLAEYNVVPHYTVDYRDLKMIGEMPGYHRANSIRSVISDSDSETIEIKQEIEQNSETEDYSNDNRDVQDDSTQCNVDSYNDDNKGVTDVEIKQEVEYDVEVNCDEDFDEDNNEDTGQAIDNDTHEPDANVDDDDVEIVAVEDVDKSSHSDQPEEEWSMICVPKMPPTKRKFVSNGSASIKLNTNKRHSFGTKKELESKGKITEKKMAAIKGKVFFQWSKWNEIRYKQTLFICKKKRSGDSKGYRNKNDGDKS